MANETAEPALRISNIVYGRLFEGNRVTYLLDHHGNGKDRAVPETVVLKRWRARRHKEFKFGGCRLSSTLWRAVQVAFPIDVRKLPHLSHAEIEEITLHKASLLFERKLRLPASGCLKVLFHVVGATRLSTLIDRHTSMERQNRSGVPDLFLYALDAQATPKFSRFVEVKKPDEPVRPDQTDEIKLLNVLGLRARVLRLIER
jgi:hypothetical protein